MSPRNQDVLRDVLDALNRRDIPRLVSLMSPEIEWRPALTAGGSLEGAVYTGHEGVSDYVNDLDAEFSDTSMSAGQLRDIDPSRVLYRGHVHARGRVSGITLEVPIWAVWEFREGKMLRGTAFLTEAEALEAAGLRE